MHKLKWNGTDLKTRLQIISVLILLSGISSSALIYLGDLSSPDSAQSYQAADGFVYHAKPEDSKAYIHDLKLYGGKANVFADKFTRWFEGLWHGKSLAFTLAFITISIATLLLIIAKRLSSDL
ncbi:MAG: hypothetical protein HQL10_12930 [Nitrospirae bacterium]|nr:hypothetical protein [Nitrospirota bacterium]